MFQKLSIRSSRLGFQNYRRFSAEAKIKEILTSKFGPSKLQVTDTSGGCGAMYDIKIESMSFKGKSLVAQHKLVTAALKEEIKEMHGLTLTTAVPKSI